MTVQEFAAYHPSGLSDPVLALSELGLQRMDKSHDAAHNRQHIERLIDTFHLLLGQEPSLRVNPSVVLLAICWHDTWKAAQTNGGVIQTLWQQYWDGVGSARLFVRQAQKFPLSIKTVSEIAYAIRVHGMFRVLPRRTVESRVLHDLDLLDEWSLERLKELQIQHAKPLVSSENSRRFVRWYFQHVMLRHTERMYYTAWARALFRVRQAEFIPEAEKLLKQYFG